MPSQTFDLQFGSQTVTNRIVSRINLNSHLTVRNSFVAVANGTYFDLLLKKWGRAENKYLTYLIMNNVFVLVIGKLN